MRVGWRLTSVDSCCPRTRLAWNRQLPLLRRWFLPFGWFLSSGPILVPGWVGELPDAGSAGRQEPHWDSGHGSGSWTWSTGGMSLLGSLDPVLEGPRSGGLPQLAILVATGTVGRVWPLAGQSPVFLVRVVPRVPVDLRFRGGRRIR